MGQRDPSEQILQWKGRALPLEELAPFARPVSAATLSPFVSCAATLNGESQAFCYGVVPSWTGLDVVV